MQIRTALFLLCLPLAAQRVLSTGTAHQNGVGIAYETRLEPSGSNFSILSGTFTDSSGIHRYLADPKERKYTGYDVVVEPRAEAGVFLVGFHALSVPLSHLKLEDPQNWVMLPLPNMPAPQTVKAGDVIALELLANPATGQKIVDYIRVFAGSYSKAGSARDFSIHDAELVLSQPQLQINGQSPVGIVFNGSLSGAVGWFYVEGYGRYAFTLASSSGYQLAGEVRGKTITFRSDDRTFSIECASNIAPGGASYNVYVRRDAGWRPASGSEKLIWGTTDRPEHIR